MVVVVAVTTMMPMLHAAGLGVNPDNADGDVDAPIDWTHINPVDLCLFVCHSCFQQVGYNPACVCKHYIGPVGRPTGSLSASYKKNSRLVGRLGPGRRLVANRADVALANRVD